MTGAAPLHADLARGPAGGRASWLWTEDGLRLRAGHWRPEGARGTVLLFPGRTEYVEKYGPAAATFAAAGLATLTVDWRGQGLADRMLGDRLGGHVMRFSDYQLDVAALLDHARALDLPRPWHLLAHSMGGCIGLRSLVRGLDVATATFTAPMWGIGLAPVLRPFAWSLSWASRGVGLDARYAPGTSGAAYANEQPFEDNLLTSDPDTYAWMGEQVAAVPELALGGPSLRWLHEALVETRALHRLPSPEVPALCFLGTDEDVVDPERVRDRMARWPGGTLAEVEGGRHEVMMERPGLRDPAFARMIAHFDAHA